MKLTTHINKLQILTLIVALIYSCSSPKVVEKASVSKNINSATSLSYYLPKTVLKVSVKIIHTRRYKGPFADYTSRYLGINTGVISQDDDEYSILNVDVMTTSMPDTSKKFYIYPISDQPQLVNITSDGLLAGINLSNVVDNRNFEQSFIKNTEKEFVFKELSIKPIVDITDRITYEYKKIDSSLVRVPKENKKTIIRNHEQLALEAAKFISTIRQNKFQIMAGISESNQLPTNISQNILELNKLEKNYLELFLGHMVKDTITYYFTYVPDDVFDADPNILFYFSSTKGIVKAPSSIRINNDLNGIPVNIVFAKSNSNNHFSINASDGIAYCDPAIANVKIFMRNKIFFNNTVAISQWGTILTLPKHIVTNDKYSVKFDIVSGRLLNIKPQN